MKKLMTALAVLLLVTTGVSAFDDTFTYQARVFSPPGSGTPIPDNASNQVDVYIYNMSSGGTPLWSTTVFVPSKNGFINVEVSGFGNALDFKEQYWLGIRVNNDPSGELTPRHKLTAAPYAGRAVFVENIDTTTRGMGPITVTGSAGANEAVFMVTSGAGTAISAVTLDGNEMAAISGMNKSIQPQTAGVYGFSEAGLGVYGQSTATAGTGVYGENTVGIGVRGRGVTGVAGTTDAAGGIGLYGISDYTGSPLLLEGGGNALFSGPGLVIDSMASPAALWVSFTAGAWPAMKIDAPNAQALKIMGGNTGMGWPAVKVDVSPFASNLTAIEAVGRGSQFGPGYGVSATAQGGTGVMGIGVTGVAAVADNYGIDTALYTHGASYMYGGVTVVATGGADPWHPALGAYNDSSTSQAVHGKNPNGTAVMGTGNVGVHGVSPGNFGTGVHAKNEYATGADGGAALYIAGKIKASGGVVAGSPVGMAVVPAGVNPSVNVTNNLCQGNYHVIATPFSQITANGGQARATWYVQKNIGSFTIRIFSEGASTDSNVDFSYIIINE